MQRQRSDGFRQDSDTGVDGRGLERCSLIDRLAAGTCAEEKAVWTGPETVFRAGSCGEQSRQEWELHGSPPEMGMKKIRNGLEAMRPGGTLTITSYLNKDNVLLK